MVIFSKIAAGEAESPCVNKADKNPFTIQNHGIIMTKFSSQFGRISIDQSVKLISLFCTSAATVITPSCQNEEAMKRDYDSENLKKLSSSQRFFHWFLRKELPTPRLLSPSDPIFHSPAMKKCLKERAADEKRLAKFQQDIIACAKANDRKCIESCMQRVNEVLYGEGVTMQAREEFLVKYGCTPYDDKILDTILSFNRPIMDVGGKFAYFNFIISKASIVPYHQLIFHDKIYPLS